MASSRATYERCDLTMTSQSVPTPFASSQVIPFALKPCIAIEAGRAIEFTSTERELQLTLRQAKVMRGSGEKQ